MPGGAPPPSVAILSRKVDDYIFNPEKPAVLFEKLVEDLGNPGFNPWYKHENTDFLKEAIESAELKKNEDKPIPKHINMKFAFDLSNNDDVMMADKPKVGAARVDLTPEDEIAVKKWKLRAFEATKPMVHRGFRLGPHPDDIESEKNKQLLRSNYIKSTFAVAQRKYCKQLLAILKDKQPDLTQAEFEETKEYKDFITTTKGSEGSKSTAQKDIGWKFETPADRGPTETDDVYYKRIAKFYHYRNPGDDGTSKLQDILVDAYTASEDTKDEIKGYIERHEKEDASGNKSWPDAANNMVMLYHIQLNDAKQREKNMEYDQMGDDEKRMKNEEATKERKREGEEREKRKEEEKALEMLRRWPRDTLIDGICFRKGEIMPDPSATTQIMKDNKW